ncbi:MAG: pyridoxamine 5'-phosphate oxidase family protein [Novosphingobium sp.]|jgi:predicted pyridoxine 5'-phosphate oxidase superfamily flavin-nucleotide-binding protein|uniref:pyridoxamine 5'-phosphate oxidase family protein n=1 Tax=Novosphingobium sp. TaxID=1874826 RepID=UPI0022BFC538|nr:pyridoxamine 5'-phosphate oxidase family protein [Novosphingobium sp.]MCZ8035931.1 pyridoxamine 5'-phosphate oxidase family protein [Novosphingobium sp.]
MTDRSLSSDVAFTPAVKALQQRKGSRGGYRRMEEKGGWQTTVTPELAAFLAERDSFFLATASADGQPYIQHRGGAAGFLRVIDERTLGFADFRGNRQYVSLGNLSENPKAYLFLIDYARRQRIKIWGTARVVEDDPALIERLRPEGYAGTPEQAILFEIAAWDANCPQHIPQLIAAKDVAAALAERDRRILVLEAELARARAIA